MEQGRRTVLGWSLRVIGHGVAGGLALAIGWTLVAGASLVLRRPAGAGFSSAFSQISDIQWDEGTNTLSFTQSSGGARSITLTGFAEAGAGGADADTLGGLACSEGDVPRLTAGVWTCATAANADTDTLAGLVCATGQVATYGSGGWECATPAASVPSDGLPTGAWCGIATFQSGHQSIYNYAASPNSASLIVHCDGASPASHCPTGFTRMAFAITAQHADCCSDTIYTCIRQ